MMLGNKKKIVHIHTDYKFIHNSNFFDGPAFENKIIIIQNQELYNGIFKDKAILLSHNADDLKNIKRICKNSDLVVLYDLDLIKCRIALALPKNVKIAWRFFGYELYGRKLDLVVSKKTKEIIAQSRRIPNHNLLNPIKKIYQMLKFGFIPDKYFLRAIERIDYMLILSNEEYNFLKNYWSILPEFIKIPHRYYDKGLTIPDFELKNQGENPIIVLGNNRSIYNNHLDLIDLIEKCPEKVNYNFILLFNYGQDGAYADAVKNAIKGKSEYTLIDKFISPEEFDLFYPKISTLVINGYRQMAGANIFLALRNGAKVYLNDKNVYMQWLKNEGIAVFSITDFDKDLKDGNIQLDYETAEKNLEQLKLFSKRYTKEDFQKRVYNKILNNQ